MAHLQRQGKQKLKGTFGTSSRYKGSAQQRKQSSKQRGNPQNGRRDLHETTDKRLVSKIYKELKLNTRETNKSKNGQKI